MLSSFILANQAVARGFDLVDADNGVECQEAVSNEAVGVV